MTTTSPILCGFPVAHLVGETLSTPVESVAPRRVLVTPHPGLERHTYLTGSATRV